MEFVTDDNRNEPKYEAFSRFLLNQIQSGLYKPGDKLPSERDMAKMYNIAHMTINKALNGLVSAGYLERMPPRGTFVKEVQQRLKSAVVVMDYRSIHAIFPQPLQHAMADAGYVLTMFDLYNVVQQPNFFLDFCKQQLPDLLLVEGYSIFPFDLLSQLSAELPVIFLNRFEHAPGLNASYILTDTEQTGLLAMEMLMAHGCRRIGILTGQPDTAYHTDLKIATAAGKTLTAAGWPAPLILEPQDQNEENLEKLLSEHQCDGYFATMDSYLVPLVKTARRLKIAIPEELVLVGRNNTPWADSFELTSLDMQSGRFTAVIRQLAAKPGEKQTVMVPVAPVYRRSCPQVQVPELKIV